MENIDQIKADLQKSIDEAGVALKTKASNAEDLAQKAIMQTDSLLKAMEGLLSKEDAQKMQEQIDKLDIANQKHLKIQDNRAKSFRESIYDAIAEKKNEINDILNKGGKQSGPLVLNIKSPVTVGLYNTVEAEGSVSHYSITSDTGIVSAIRKRILTYLQNVSVGALSVDKPYAMWIEELDEQGDPIFLGEGDEKPIASVRYEEREAKAKKIAVYGKVTTEMLRYANRLVNYMQNNLAKRLEIKTENQLFNGDGNGDNLIGLLSKSSAFTGGSLAGTLPADSANNFDVIRAVALQVFEAHGNASVIFIRPGELAAMELSKGDDNHYVLPPFATADGTTVSGVRLVETTALNSTSFDFVGGDMSVVNVEFLLGLTVQIGLDGNDFINNKKTVLLEQELVQFVSANDTQVLVKGTFSAAKLILETT